MGYLLKNSFEIAYEYRRDVSKYLSNNEKGDVLDMNGVLDEILGVVSITKVAVSLCKSILSEGYQIFEALVIL